MFARPSKTLIVVALVLMTGAHWAALQTVAWTTMLANNLRTQSVSEAVVQTFDGKHLCPLCKAIAAGQKTEKKSEAISPVLKMEFPLAAEKVVLFPPAQVEVLLSTDCFAEFFLQKPALPPPRAPFA